MLAKYPTIIFPQYLCIFLQFDGPGSLPIKKKNLHLVPMEFHSGSPPPPPPKKKGGCDTYQSIIEQMYIMYDPLLCWHSRINLNG